MKLPHRRQFLHLAAGAAALPTVSRMAWAQIYPNKPIRIITHSAAGGAPDDVQTHGKYPSHTRSPVSISAAVMPCDSGHGRGRPLRCPTATYGRFRSFVVSTTELPVQ